MIVVIYTQTGLGVRRLSRALHKSFIRHDEPASLLRFQLKFIFFEILLTSFPKTILNQRRATDVSEISQPTNLKV